MNLVNERGLYLLLSGSFTPVDTVAGGIVGGLIGHYAGESAGDWVNDKGVDRVAASME